MPPRGRNYARCSRTYTCLRRALRVPISCQTQSSSMVSPRSPLRLLHLTVPSGQPWHHRPCPVQASLLRRTLACTRRWVSHSPHMPPTFWTPHHRLPRRLLYPQTPPMAYYPPLPQAIPQALQRRHVSRPCLWWPASRRARRGSWRAAGCLLSCASSPWPARPPPADVLPQHGGSSRCVHAAEVPSTMSLVV